MINVSNDFKKRMEENRDFRNYAEITFADGTTSTLDDSQFTASNNSLSDGADISSFPIGEAVEKIAQLEILNDEQQYADKDFLGAKIRLYIDFQVDDTGKTERIEKGTYTVITPETYGETVIITAYDDMYKADKDYTTSLTFPQTAGAVLINACSTCGILLGSVTFLHNDFIIRNKPEGKFREVIGNIAMIACGNARIDRTNQLQIISYDFSGWETEGKYHLLNEFVSPKIDYNDTSITGFKTIVKGETSEEDTEILQGTDTYCITVENPLISGQEQTVLSWLLERIGNVPFRPFSGDAISNPLVEFMDLAKVQDRRGNQYNTFVTDVNFLMPGYTTLKNSTPSATRFPIAYTSNSARVEQRARQLVENEKNARELAVERLREALAQGSGLYPTEEIQPDGSTIYYLHDKPTRAESKVVIMLTNEGIGISQNGGKDYPWGITFTGQAILELIYAVGINCDYLTTGAIVVKDDNGDIIFQVDIDTKKVLISGDSIRIGGKSLEEKLEEATPLSMILSNEYDGISTDSSGKYTGTLSAKTKVQTFYGQKDVSGQCTYTHQESSGVKGSWNNTERTYTVTELTTDTGWVDITANYMDLFSVTKRFNVSKVKDGATGPSGSKGDTGAAGRTYFIELSANILKRGADNGVTPSTITANAYYRDGSGTTRSSYAGRWIVSTSTNGTSFTTVSTSTVNEYRKTYSVLSLSPSIVAVRFTLYAAGGTTNILDMQTIPVVVDVDSLTHEQIFNLLTNNGKVQGIFQKDNQLYVNAEYISAENLSAISANLGLFSINENGVFYGYDGTPVAPPSYFGSFSQKDMFGIKSNNTIMGMNRRGTFYIHDTSTKKESRMDGEGADIEVLNLYKPNGNATDYEALTYDLLRMLKPKYVTPSSATSPGGTTVLHVKFPVTFSGTPSVVACTYASTDNAVASVTVSNITTSGFDARIHNVGSVTAYFGVYYMASV